MVDPDTEKLHLAIEGARRAEKRQALAYRRLAAEAELAADEDLAQRFHALHADEQHHLSRLTARLLELGGQPVEVDDVSAEPVTLAEWRDVVERAEAAEIERYESLLAGSAADEETRALLEGIPSVERRHATELGGKWTMA